MLPLSSNMSAFLSSHTFHLGSLTFPASATAAGDGQVRVFDLLRSPRTVTCGRGDSKISPLLISRCHSGYAKRIAIEDSPSQFLSVGEVPLDHIFRVRHDPLIRQGRNGTPA
jgi:hypothetical protein